MKIFTLLRKGWTHPVFCEDFLISLDIDSNFFVGAVMDGCSSATDSHFASTLMGKILKKHAKLLPYQSFYSEKSSPSEVGKWLLVQLFNDLIKTRNELLLEPLEMLATLNLLIYNKIQKNIWIIALGDGVIKINDQLIEIDQDNRPDYLAYHLGENFSDWFQVQKNIYEYLEPQDISISSDGVMSFQSYKTDLPEGFSPVDFLLNNTEWSNQPNMLTRKFNILEKTYGFKPADDIGILRIIF
jgi:hypothetical protein